MTEGNVEDDRGGEGGEVIPKKEGDDQRVWLRLKQRPQFGDPKEQHEWFAV